jgi:hypothetical protein
MRSREAEGSLTEVSGTFGFGKELLVRRTESADRLISDKLGLKVRRLTDCKCFECKGGEFKLDAK